ncbi:phosphoribosyl-AMP cyclohydrolase [Flammeovirga yaeyamensis]|uniref:Histidine biosynthesis bifunctional protein HisIE n=1 Tax=Flammeovirga yaeyamensis TaxID=367791 RepID=A0AAX1N5H2_9BACT|nr:MULTISPECIES: phosphoribosyl-AMP cyclohydrolase [Flammeovirga]ANQ51163.1 phosphoribosyl-AMP cyclohydrolase [Flammeovirga sp. MY04]MBB3698194.1 phosphoribosyl-AMP cyclohydrolase [Flammeovirga yaeyamensis]NMF34451.1 phosphoribosyl-AMP cyclohydrolase [Flammeovirga yaeyamensis]QWG01430.1 phosphoribosyl-AMP cyclohydrolase [Flammeovirga yaeyamensis]
MENNFKIELEEGLSAQLQFDKRGGLLPVIVQEKSTGQILMLGYANQEAFDKTLRTQKATFWSTSRQELWTKGETSGNYLKIENIMVDCDQDAIIYQVELMGSGVCHTFDKNGENRKACFYRNYDQEENKLSFIEGME